jgi:hypothetical protein
MPSFFGLTMVLKEMLGESASALFDDAKALFKKVIDGA